MLSQAMACEPEQVTRTFYLNTYPSIFQSIGYSSVYSPVAGCVAKVLSYIITIAWAYRDLFILNIAFALKFGFLQLNEALKRCKHRDMPAGFWHEQRLRYRKLASLVNEVDDAISSITLLSFSVNIFFICAELFLGL